MTRRHVRIIMTVVTISLSLSAFADYAYFTQSTVASHEDGSNHNWPCMARLSDDRMLVVWARLTQGVYTVVGAFSTDSGCSWTPPQTFVAQPGVVNADPSIVVSGKRVLVTATCVPSEGGIRTSVTWCVRSEDDGHIWSAPYTIPMGRRYTCGKTHRGLRLKSGALLMGYSWDVVCEKGETLQAEGQMDLRAGVLRSTDNGETWTNAGDTTATYEKISGGAVSGTDEPAIVQLEDGSVYMLMRTGSTHLFEARSTDEGQSWHDVQSSPLTGSNAPAALSTFEAVRAGANEDRHGIFVVWDNAANRYPLCAAASLDGGHTWSPPKDIGFPYTGGQASYPSCVQAPDGALLAVWQQDVPGGRDIRLARFNLAWLLQEGAATVPAQPASDSPERTIVLFGDSTTAPRGPLRVTATLLGEELPAMGIRARVINAGVPSDTTVQARERFETTVLSQKPDIVTVWLGINDSAVDVWNGATEPRVPLPQFEENLKYFVKTLREHGAHPILLTPNALAWTPELKRMYGKPPYKPDEPEGFSVTLVKYVSAIRTIATAENVPLVDVFQIFEDYAEQHPTSRLLLDGMHPNDEGHRIVADALLPVIKRELSD